MSKTTDAVEAATPDDDAEGPQVAAPGADTAAPAHPSRGLAAAGYVVLAFDYRHYGASGGEPRNHLDPRDQQQDVTLQLQEP